MPSITAANRKIIDVSVTIAETLGRKNKARRWRAL
jgi:hypothetical protein